MYTTQQVAGLCGVSLRQLQWWDERGLLRVRQHGHRRIYHDSDLRVVAVVAQLRLKGMSLQAVRRALPKIARSKDGFALVGLGGRLVQTVHNGAEALEFAARLRTSVYVVRLDARPRPA